MRLQLAALIVTAAIAIVAAVFAIWPVVADAPWERDTPCEVARSYKARVDEAIGLKQRYAFYRDALQEEKRLIEWDIERYCSSELPPRHRFGAS